MIEPIIDSLEYKEMSDETYFSSDYKQYISNSRLALINPEQDGSIEKFLENAHKSTSSLSLGSAVHELVLQPEEFTLVPKCNKPTAKLGMMADYLFKYFKIDQTLTDERIIEASDAVDYYKGKMDSKKIENVKLKCHEYLANRVLYEAKAGNYKEPIFLDDASYDKCVACVKSIEDNKEIQKLLHPSDTAISMNEAALFMDFKYTDEETGKSCIIHFKSKLDNFTIDNNDVVLNDLKTTGHYVDQFKDSWEKYHYYRQGACYSYLLSLYAKKYYNIENINSFKCNFLLVSTVPTFKSSVFKMTDKDMQRGWDEFIKLMNLVGNVRVSEL